MASENFPLYVLSFTKMGKMKNESIGTAVGIRGFA